MIWYLGVANATLWGSSFQVQKKLDTNGYVWCLPAYRSTCWPLGTLSKCLLQTPCWHAGFSYFSPNGPLFPSPASHSYIALSYQPYTLLLLDLSLLSAPLLLSHPPFSSHGLTESDGYHVQSITFSPYSGLFQISLAVLSPTSTITTFSSSTPWEKSCPHFIRPSGGQLTGLPNPFSPVTIPSDLITQHSKQHAPLQRDSHVLPLHLLVQLPRRLISQLLSLAQQCLSVLDSSIFSQEGLT